MATLVVQLSAQKPFLVKKNAPSQLENDTIQNFEAVLDSARSIREAPLTQHQLSLTQQLQDIGAAGYGNK